jgi:hypothetical protein
MNTRLSVASIALAALTLAGCSAAPTLETALVTSVAAAEGGSFTLSSVDEVTGEAFLVVCPYESKESVEERLGFAWRDAPDYAQTDDRQTVATISGNEVLSSSELDRSEVDFCAAGSWSVLPVDSELTVEKSGDTVQVSPAS